MPTRDILGDVDNMDIESVEWNSSPQPKPSTQHKPSSQHEPSQSHVSTLSQTPPPGPNHNESLLPSPIVSDADILPPLPLPSPPPSVVVEGVTTGEFMQQDTVPSPLPPTSEVAAKATSGAFSGAAKWRLLDESDKEAHEVGPLGKKVKIVPFEPPSTDSQLPALPDNPAKWIKNAYDSFCSDDLGTCWTRLVCTWLLCEIQCYPSASGKLGTTSRPGCIAEWIARARSPTYIPASVKVDNLDAFQASFWKWWTSVQPAWRLEEGVERPKRVDGEDWSSVHIFGSNGVTSVLAALFYWGRIALRTKGTAVAAWMEAIEDVQWVLNHDVPSLHED